MDGNDLKVAGVGGALALTGLWLMKSARARVRRCSATACGRIVRVDENRTREKEGGRQKTHYTPVVEYVVDGRTFGPTSGGVYSTSKRDYVVGNSIEIRYNPGKPEEFLLKGGSGFAFGLILSLLGGLILFFGLKEMAK